MSRKLVIAHIGNGKSTNRYHLPFSLNRPEKIKIKSIYQRTLRPTGWLKKFWKLASTALLKNLSRQVSQTLQNFSDLRKKKMLLSNATRTGDLTAIF